jgi:hypothetical protein
VSYGHQLVHMFLFYRSLIVNFYKSDAQNLITFDVRISDFNAFILENVY